MSITIGIQCSLGGRLSLSAKRFKAILDFNKIDVKIIDINYHDFIKNIEGINYYIFPYVHCDSEVQLADILMPIVDDTDNVNSYPNWQSRWHYNDKIKGDLLLRKIGAPVIDTWIFFDFDSANNWSEQAEYPIIFKLKGGASSLNVVKLENKQELKRIIKQAFSYTGIKSGRIPSKSNLRFLWDITRLFGIRKRIAALRGKFGPEGAFPYWQIYKDQVIFQRFLPNNLFDTRVTIIGEIAYAFRRFNRHGDFRASGSGNIDYDITKIDNRCIQIAFEISKKKRFQSMAYDFLFDEQNAPRVVEVSYTYSDVAIFNCPGYFDANMIWHEGHLWPQLAILWELLGTQELKQPENLLVISDN